MRDLFVIIICFAFIAMSGVTSEAKTIRVPGDYDRIRDAGRFAEGGDIIIVEPGVYEEGILIDTMFMKSPGPVTLQGSGAKNTIIRGGIAVGSGKITEPFKIDGFGIEGDGIFVQTASITISHCFITKILSDFGTGIGLDYTPDCKIRVEENIIKDVSIGIACSDNIEEKNNSNVLIVNNIITNNGTGVSCNYTSPKLRGNRITSNQIGIYIGGANPDIGTKSDPGNNTIYNNAKYDIQHSTDGVIYAEHNYWGDPEGPVKGGVRIFNLQGAGWVDYDPWLWMDEAWSFSVQPQKKLSTTWGKLKIGQHKHIVLSS